jgi:hypothetical protein
MGRIEFQDDWRTPLEPHEVRRALGEALAWRRARVTCTEDGLQADGGHRIAYRIIGSRSKNYARWTPWSAEVRVSPADPGGSAVRIHLATNQGYYAYQGEPTRLKWTASLNDVVTELRRATKANADSCG